MLYDLVITNIHGRLLSLWDGIEESFYLKDINQGKNFQREKLQRLREQSLTEVSNTTRDLWLNQYGLVERRVNRDSHKKFLPDGSWISKGVRFGP